MDRLRYHGFTLVEIMVVVAIIGILAAVTVANFGDIRTTARDAERIENLKAVATALQLFEVKYGRLPDCEAGIQVGGTAEQSVCADANLLATHFTEALSTLPEDPLGTDADDRFIYYGQRTCADGTERKLVWTILELPDQDNREAVCGIGSGGDNNGSYESFNGVANPPLHVIAIN